jgi:hypothetical protein
MASVIMAQEKLFVKAQSTPTGVRKVESKVGDVQYWDSGDPGFCNRHRNQIRHAKYRDGLRPRDEQENGAIVMFATTHGEK